MIWSANGLVWVFDANARLAKRRVTAGEASFLLQKGEARRVADNAVQLVRRALPRKECFRRIPRLRMALLRTLEGRYAEDTMAALTARRHSPDVAHGCTLPEMMPDTVTPPVLRTRTARETEWRWSSGSESRGSLTDEHGYSTAARRRQGRREFRRAVRCRLPLRHGCRHCGARQQAECQRLFTALTHRGQAVERFLTRRFGGSLSRRAARALFGKEPSELSPGELRALLARAASGDGERDLRREVLLAQT